MNSDLKFIKKYYGEDMMHFCRDNFPKLLDKEGVITNIFKKSFYPNKYLFNDIKNMTDNFKSFILEQYDDKTSLVCTIEETPFELMDKVGYKLYECKTEEEIQKFRKYYAPDEELCTFRGGRLETCHVFFAVKKNVDEIKRENFTKPQRQDEYGTSVISIQFAKGVNNYLSIKNRYNHKVNNPDATYGNNLNNIVANLENSFKCHYGFNFVSNQTNFEIPNYVLGPDKRYYKYNYEINNIYYCTDNIIIDNGNVNDTYNLDKSRYILADYFIIDLKKREIISYDIKLDDYMEKIYRKNIKKIWVSKIGKCKIINIINNNDSLSYITIDEFERIIEYENNDLKIIGNNFLTHNKYLKVIEINKIREIGNDFLKNNEELKKISLPLVKRIGHSFLSKNDILDEFSAPMVERIETHFLEKNTVLKELNLPNLEFAGYHFLLSSSLKKIIVPKLEEVESEFMSFCRNLEEYDFSSLRKIGRGFLRQIRNIESFCLPNAKEIDSYFLENAKIKELDLPNVELIGDNSLSHCFSLEKINAPKLVSVGTSFLKNSKLIKKIYFPSLENASDMFMNNCELLEDIVAPNLSRVGDEFLSNNICLKRIVFPKLVSVGKYFICNNISINYIELPLLRSISDDFLKLNKELVTVSLDNVEVIGDRFMGKNNKIKNVTFSKLKKVGNNFYCTNNSILEISLPNLEEAGSFFLSNNNVIKKAIFPNLKTCDKNFLMRADSLEYIDVSNLSYCQSEIFGSVRNLKAFRIPDRLFICPSLSKKHKQFVKNKVVKILTLRWG